MESGEQYGYGWKDGIYRDDAGKNVVYRENKRIICRQYVVRSCCCR